MLGGVDVHRVQLGQQLAGERVYLHDAVNIIAEELNAQGQLLVRRLDFQGVAADAELAPAEVNIIALVLHVHQLAEELLPVVGGAPLQAGDKAAVFLGFAQAVDAGYRGDNEHVAALKEGAGGGVAQLVNLLVDINLFFDVGVGAGDIGFRLVVVVVADEVLHGVFGEELLELAGRAGRPGSCCGR